MADQQAEAVPTNAAAPSGADTAPVIDVENVTMEQLENLFERGSAELPVKAGGEKSQEEPAKPKVEAPAPAKVEAGETPPAVVEPVVAAEEVVDSRTPEEIETAATEAAEAVKAEGGDEAAQTAAAEAARAPVAAEAEVKPEPEDKSRRFRVKDPIAQAALDLYKTFENTDAPISLAEAERRVRGEAAPVAKEPVEPAKVEPALQEVVTTLETEVADIKAKMAVAGGDEGLYTAEIATLTVELAEKTADLKLAKRDLKQQEQAAQASAQSATTAFKAKVDESRAKAIKAYPDVANDATPLGKAVAARIAAMRDKSHPNHQVLFTGSAPQFITKEVADELGIKPVAETAAPTPPKPKVTTPAPKKVTPVSGARSTAAAAKTPEDAKKQTVDYLRTEASLDELDDAFGAKDPLRLIAV
jgi:hypothetical protein